MGTEKKGQIVAWNPNKGYGQVRFGNKGGRTAYLHASAFEEPIEKGHDLRGRWVKIFGVKQDRKGPRVTKAKLLPFQFRVVFLAEEYNEHRLVAVLDNGDHLYFGWAPDGKTIRVGHSTSYRGWCPDAVWHARSDKPLPGFDGPFDVTSFDIVRDGDVEALAFWRWAGDGNWLVVRPSRWGSDGVSTSQQLEAPKVRVAKSVEIVEALFASEDNISRAMALPGLTGGYHYRQVAKEMQARLTALPWEKMLSPDPYANEIWRHLFPDDPAEAAELIFLSLCAKFGGYGHWGTRSTECPDNTDPSSDEYRIWRCLARALANVCNEAVKLHIAEKLERGGVDIFFFSLQRDSQGEDRSFILVWDWGYNVVSRISG